MADNDDYEILYLKYLEKIGLTSASVSQRNSEVKCRQNLFQNIKEENYQQANYQRINLTNRQIQLNPHKLEFDQIVPSTSEDKSPMQEIQTSLLQEVKLFNDINDHSNNTNICYKYDELRQQQIELEDQQQNSQKEEIKLQQPEIQVQEIGSQQILENNENPNQLESEQNPKISDQNNNNLIIQEAQIETTNQQFQEQEIKNQQQLEEECIQKENEPAIRLNQVPSINQCETSEQKCENQQLIVNNQVAEERQQPEMKSKKMRKREKQKLKQKLKKNKNKKKKKPESPQQIQQENPVVSNPVCSLFNQLIAGLSNNTKINWSKYKYLQKKIKKKRSILQRTKFGV